MFAPRYFAPRYFAPRFFAEAGAAGVIVPTTAGGCYYAPRFFAPRYFAPRYWPDAAAATALVIPYIRQAVAAAILADPSCSSLVGTNVRPLRLCEADGYPGITFQMISNPREHSLAGAAGASRARFQISAISRWPEDTEQIAVALRLLFDGYVGVLSGVQIFECNLHDEHDFIESPEDGSDSGIVRTALDFIFFYREPVKPR